MNSRRALVAAFGRKFARAALILWSIAVFGAATFGVAGAAPIDDQLRVADSTSDEEQAFPETGTAEAATADEPESEADAAGPAGLFDGAEAPVVITSPTTQQRQTLPEQANKTSVSALEPIEVQRAIDSIEVLDECFVPDICIDRYLWALYQRAPKQDSISVQERRKVAVRKRGRLVTVTKTFTRLADEDFSWKDPKAAEKTHMTMVDYVIGGMDRRFKVRLFQMLHAAEEAGLSPGITSAFRDDYRQSIASGLKAASNRSYHGGSLHGGYGHGLAADIVSVKGATRAERLTSTEALWKWTDAHGREFGIGRPYLDRDPPHVGPIDGKEYADHHRGTKARQVKAAAIGKLGKARPSHARAESVGGKSAHRADGSNHERRLDRSHT